MTWGSATPTPSSAWLRRPPAAWQPSRAKDDAAALRRKLTEATDSFLKPKGGISAERLAEIEQQLASLIADAERRSVSRKAPQAMLDLLSAAEFGAVKVRPVWDGLPVAAQREVLRLLFNDIHIGKPVHILSRWSTDTDRLAAATARMSVRWRRPGTPVVAAREPGEKPGRGGARAQRRRRTSIELADQRQDAGTAA
jgi:hypothetical protein